MKLWYEFLKFLKVSCMKFFSQLMYEVSNAAGRIKYCVMSEINK